MNNLTSPTSKASKLIVQKYGGATLATPEQIKQVAKRIHHLHKSGTQVVVVVSAMGQTTNQLIELARQVSPNPHLRELDMLLTVGERMSMSLLSMALNDLGSSAISFTGSQAGILTDDSHVNASIIDVKAFRVEAALKEHKIVILAGFQGVSPVTKEITTLGRGGSDTSAVAMAGYLKADQCEILKDVDAIYTADPKIVKDAKPIHQLNYSQLLEMTKWGAKVLHSKSVEMAEIKNVQLFVGAATELESKSPQPSGTVISNNTLAAQQKNFLSVNSYSIVFKMQFTKSTAASLSEYKKEFYDYINSKQIATPDILYIEDNFFYVTGPKENLDLIQKIDFKNSKFKLITTELCSVSLTCGQTPSIESTNVALKKLSEKNIPFEKQVNSENNINFFLDQKTKAEVIQLLHSLI
ncbi:MAG: aspartate kinase [Pseudobdellovibrio sp.]